MSQPSLTELPKITINTPDLGLEKKVKMPIFGTTYHFPSAGIRTPNVIVGFEEFEARETFSFSLNEDTIALVLKGKAELTYFLAGTHYTEEKRMTVEEGDVCVLPLGAYVEWKVALGARFRHLCIMMRRTGLP